MPIEKEDDYSSNMTNADIRRVLFEHTANIGSEWHVIDPDGEPTEEFEYFARNWPGDIVNSLREREVLFPPSDYVLIVRRYQGLPHDYTIQAYPRKK